MNIIIMRHGEAIHHAKTDALRPLSPHGVKQSSQVGHWLHQEGQLPTHVWVSPFLRAQQTWEHVKKAFDHPFDMTTVETITPSGDPKIVARSIYALMKSTDKETTDSQQEVTLMIVSHLPLVGYLVETLCPEEMIPMFGTANLAGIKLSNTGEGQLLWHGGLIQPS